MQQISENLMILGPGDQPPSNPDECLKIYLTGSLGTTGNQLPWQQKFINALTKMTTKDSGSPLDLTTHKFVVINPFGPSNGEPTIDNQEYVQKRQWELSMMGMADAIFCNFLKKSQSPYAIHDYLLYAQSGKLICRCPSNFVYYPQVKIVADAFGIRLLGDADSAIKVMSTLFESNQRFIESSQYGIQE